MLGAGSFQEYFLPNTWHQKPSVQAVHCSKSGSQTKGRLAFKLQGISRISISHIDLSLVKGFKGGPDVGLTPGYVPSVWATVGGRLNDTAPSPLILSQHETG